MFTSMFCDVFREARQNVKGVDVCERLSDVKARAGPIAAELLRVPWSCNGVHKQRV